MTIDVVGLTNAGRSLAEQTMVDRGTILRPSSTRVLDPVTATSTPAPATTVHTGPCRVRMSSLLELQQLAGDVQVTVIRMVVSFPASVPDVKVGDIVRIDESRDPRLVHRQFRVTSVAARSVLLYRQLAVESIA